MHLHPTFPDPSLSDDDDACKPRCVCAPGHVRDGESGACVRASACPCHHARRSYAEGDAIKKDCNTW